VAEKIAGTENLSFTPACPLVLMVEGARAGRPLFLLKKGGPDARAPELTMKTRNGWAHRIAADIRIGVLLCTRLPLSASAPIEGLDVARASWAWPVAGALVGAAGALAFWLASELRLPPPIAAAVALAATLLLTGCLHEDGLADTADGFGGGRDRTRRLAIMRDSRLGTYGACALAMSLLLRWAALSAFASPAETASALIAAHVGARAALPAFMHFVPPARADGLSAQAGRPSLWPAGAAGLIGALTLTLALGVPAAAAGLAFVTSAGFLMAGLCLRQIGGQTGDVLGALEQVIEAIILLTAVARS
jgi:adenosylcobinamide-GDP ribazoletransferase